MAKSSDPREPPALAKDSRNRPCPRRLSRLVGQRLQEPTFYLRPGAVQACLQRLDRDAQGGRGVAGALAEDVTPKEHITHRGLDLAHDDRDTVAELPIDQLLFGIGSLERELGAVIERKGMAHRAAREADAVGADGKEEPPG